MTRSAPMPDDLHAKLSAYLDDQLDATARAEVEVWLRGSPEARAMLEELRGLDASLRSVPVPDPGSAYWRGFADRVTSRVSAGDAGESLYERMSAWLFRGGRVSWLRAAGAVATLTLVGILATRGVRTSDPRSAPGALAPEAKAPAAAPPASVAMRMEAADASAPAEVIAFVGAALNDQRDQALAACRRLEQARPDAPELASMRAWIDATAPPASRPPEERSELRPSLAEPVADSPAAALPALQALDALVWPHRAREMAESTERLALQFEALAHADSSARRLATRYLAWLASAGADSAAANAWRQRLRALER